MIKGHNKKVTLKPRDQRPKYNCRKKAECPTEGDCLDNDVVYKCDIARPLPKKVYLGLAEGEWKSRFYNHSYHLNARDIPIRQLKMNSSANVAMSTSSF